MQNPILWCPKCSKYQELNNGGECRICYTRIQRDQPEPGNDPDLLKKYVLDVPEYGRVWS